MIGGEVIVGGLLHHGIDAVFGLPGVRSYGLFYAFSRASTRPTRLAGSFVERAAQRLAIAVNGIPNAIPLPTPVFCPTVRSA
jgi:thiamine pyrophosphate-dependent acetolactate synthase large subunit-like protein